MSDMKKTGFLLKRINSFIIFTFPSITNVVRRYALQLLMSKQKTLDKQTLKEALQKETQKMWNYYVDSDGPPCLCYRLPCPGWTFEMQPPDKGEEEHFHTRNPAGQSYARDTTIEKRTDLIVRCVWQKRKWWILIHLFRKAYADMYIKEEKYLQKEDCFPAPHYW